MRQPCWVKPVATGVAFVFSVGQAMPLAWAQSTLRPPAVERAPAAERLFEGGMIEREEQRAVEIALALPKQVQTIGTFPASLGNLYLGGRIPDGVIPAIQARLDTLASQLGMIEAPTATVDSDNPTTGILLTGGKYRGASEDSLLYRKLIQQGLIQALAAPPITLRQQSLSSHVQRYLPTMLPRFMA